MPIMLLVTFTDEYSSYLQLINGHTGVHRVERICSENNGHFNGGMFFLREFGAFVN